MSIIDKSEMDEATKAFPASPSGKDTNNSDALQSKSGPSTSPAKLGRDHISIPGEQSLPKVKTLKASATISNEGTSTSQYRTDNKHVFFKSTPCTFNVPVFRHNPIRLLKSDVVHAIDTPPSKFIDLLHDSPDWTALQWAIGEGVGDLLSEPTDLSENAREQLADRLCDWLGDLGCSSQYLGALVSEGDYIKDYRQQPDQKPPSTVNDWTDVYRTLSNRQKLDQSHDTLNDQESEGMSEATSLISYTESVFDAATTMSTASSAPGDTQQLISKFVDLLVRDSSVARMISRALSEPGMGQERFRRNFGRILRSYSRELRRSLEQGKPGTTDAAYGRAAAFVSHKAPHASHLIVSRFSQDMKPMPPRDGLPECGDSSSSESEESEGEDGIPNIERLESFFVRGEPFRLLRWRLRALIFPDSFLSRARTSTEQLVRMASESGLKALLSKAQQQVHPSENLWADFTDQIESLAKNMRTQCSTLGQIHVADFFQVYSAYIAARLQAVAATEQESGGQENSTSDEILQDICANTLPKVWEIDFRAHWDFIASTKAFQDFFNELRDLAYPTFFSRAEKLIGKSNELEGQRLLPILSELRSAIGRMQTGREDKPPFCISPQPHSLTDRLKLAVEASTSAEWDWWPFCPPPRYQAYNSTGGEILSWKCTGALQPLEHILTILLHFRDLSASLVSSLVNVHFQRQVRVNNAWLYTDIYEKAPDPCGVLRREMISPQYAKILRDLAETLPLSLPADINIPTVYPKSFGNHSPEGLADPVTDDSSFEGHSSRNSLSSGSTSITTSSSTENSVIISIDDNEITRFVFVLVLDSRYHLVTADVSNMTSRDFFQALTAGYQAHRGILRRIFSIYVYSHCDFVQVKRWAPNRFAPGNKFSFPPRDNDEYRYSPQPMLEAPISPHQFYELFYGCYDSECLSHRLHSVLPAILSVASTCDVLDNISDEFILCLPKRDTAINSTAQFARGDKFEVFWGLVARERRSTARIIMYTLASLVPPLVFALEWMFGWGHLGDLQNASVPFTATCALWGLLWAVVYSGSDTPYG